MNNLDRYLTARENLVLHARMHGMAPAAYNRRIDELLDLTGLPYVKAMTREGNLFRLSLSGEEALKPLLESIGSDDIRKGCPLGPSLEDVFIALTGSKVRE